MAQGASDVTAIINIDNAALTHWTGVQDEGGALTRYDFTPVGGPPSADFDADVREPLAFSLTTKIIGADAAARATFMEKFARGTSYDNVATPSATGQMHISDRPDAIGRAFVVTDSNASRTQGQPTELTVRFEESGAAA